MKRKKIIKRKRLNLFVLVELLTAIASMFYIVLVLYLMSIYSWINGVTWSLTWTGLGVLFLSIGIVAFVYDDITERIKKR